MSRHGPSASGMIASAASVPTSTLRRSSGQRLLGSAVGSSGLATVTTSVHRRAALHALGDLVLQEVRAALGELFGRDGDGLRFGDERPSHRMARAGAVGEEEGVEAVVGLLGVAAGPGRALRPAAEIRDLRVRLGEPLHRVGVLARRGLQELEEGLRRRHREHWRVDHRHAPFLAVRRRDHHAQAPHADRGVRGLGIGRAEVEAADDGVWPLGVTPARVESAAPAPFASKVPVKQTPLAWLRRWPSAGPGRRERIDQSSGVSLWGEASRPHRRRPRPRGGRPRR